MLRQLDVEKLEGINNIFRIRIGDYRVIFYVDKEERTIYVVLVEHRKHVYKEFS